MSRNLERRFRGETFRASCRLVRKDGGIVLVEADGRRVLRKGEPVIIGAVMAVDTLKRGRTEARRQRQALFRSERMAALGELLGGLAHQLDGSLTGTLAQARTIGEMAGPGPVAEQAQRMAEEAERAGQMSGVHRPRPRLPERADRGGHQRRHTTSGGSLRLRAETRQDHGGPRAPLRLPTIWGDAHRLHELAAHLIAANAIQAMWAGPRLAGSLSRRWPYRRRSTWPSRSRTPGPASREARAHLFGTLLSTSPRHRHRARPLRVPGDRAGASRLGRPRDEARAGRHLSCGAAGARPRSRLIAPRCRRPAASGPPPPAPARRRTRKAWRERSARRSASPPPGSIDRPSP